MRTLNTRYTSDAELGAFIDEHGIAEQKALLVQVFCGVVDKELIGRVQSCLAAKIPHAHVIGCTTAGEILSGKMLEWRVVVSFSCFEKTDISSLLVELEGDCEAAADTIGNMVTERTKALIVLSDGMKSNGETLIRMLAQKAPHIVIAGGRAGDNYAFEKSFVFDRTAISESAAAVVALDSDHLRVSNRYLFNWQCIGKHMEVTRASENRVYELDDKPPVDIYRHYLGDGVADALPAAGIEFPLVFWRKGIHIGRGPIATFEDGSMLFAGNIREGETVRFGFGSFGLMDEGAATLHSQLADEHIESLHIYSCSARKSFFGRDLEREFSYLQSLADTAGFFAYGEYYHGAGESELLNISTTILALSESEEGAKKRRETGRREIGNTSMTALTHLINRTSAELELLNRSLEKRVKEEVKKNRQKEHLLLQQNRHAAMGEMIRNIAHQWRQPLNALAMEMQSIEAAYDDKRLDGIFLRDRVERGMLLIEQMSATIDDFRNFFMPGKAKVDFSLSETIRDVLVIVEATFRHLGIEVVLDGMEEPVIYWGHENEFAHVILNLLNNAKDAMVATGVAKPKVTVGIRRGTREILITVEDNGGGIDPKVMEWIFDPYFTTKQDTKGMGVGLYMSKMIIEEHMGGSLGAQNSDEGARFTITLPVKERGEE